VPAASCRLKTEKELTTDVSFLKSCFHLFSSVAKNLSFLVIAPTRHGLRATCAASPNRCSRWARDVRLVQHPDEIGDAAASCCPRRRFDDCINGVAQTGISRARATSSRLQPFLGIAVVLSGAVERRSRNSIPAPPGLGVFQGSVLRFTEKPGRKSRNSSVTSSTS